MQVRTLQSLLTQMQTPQYSKREGQFVMLRSPTLIILRWSGTFFAHVLRSPDSRDASSEFRAPSLRHKTAWKEESKGEGVRVSELGVHNTFWYVVFRSEVKSDQDESLFGQLPWYHAFPRIEHDLIRSYHECLISSDIYSKFVTRSNRVPP